MFNQHSRYSEQPIREWTTPGGRRAVYVVPRRTPPPAASTPGTPVVATDSDRLDALAYRYLGTPEAWWLLADANRAVDPAEVLGEPGRQVVVPLPGTGARRP